MVRENGEWVLYFVEHYVESGDRWTQSSLDYMMFADTPKELHEEARRLIAPLSASGVCWQKLGVHASFDVKDALLVAEFIARTHPERKFRVAKVTLTQSIQPVAVFS